MTWPGLMSRPRRPARTSSRAHCPWPKRIPPLGHCNLQLRRLSRSPGRPDRGRGGHGPAVLQQCHVCRALGLLLCLVKRTAGHIYPELFRRPLTDKEKEAVSNPAKFKGAKGAGALADDDCRDRMAAIFAECWRVLKDDGIMTLMFTHKATGAWDALTKGLMEAGFIITASWPINTEAEGSMHIRDKSAANSTIFLVCRPRPEQTDEDEDLFWEDLEPRGRSAVLAIIILLDEILHHTCNKLIT